MQALLGGAARSTATSVVMDAERVEGGGAISAVLLAGATQSVTQDVASGAIVSSGTAEIVNFVHSGSVFYPLSATNLVIDSGALATVQSGGVLSGGTVEGSFPLITEGDVEEPFPSSVNVTPAGLSRV